MADSFECALTPLMRKRKRNYMQMNEKFFIQPCVVGCRDGEIFNVISAFALEFAQKNTDGFEEIKMSFLWYKLLWLTH